eukprot:Hpha_TRINITY_DN15961_c0_g1::TRINITY_DN15961_c0_g1_i8::g.71064::m.71064
MGMFARIRQLCDCLRRKRRGEERTAGEGRTAAEDIAALAQIVEQLDKSVLTVPTDFSMRRQNTVYQTRSILPPGTKGMSWELLERLTKDAGCNAAVGALMGLVVGDAVGHPLEFIDVDGDIRLPYPEDRPHLRGADEYGLDYRKEFNLFRLERGQWTDDASMALCLADSLLARGKYDGGDARVRWGMWW